MFFFISSRLASLASVIIQAYLCLPFLASRVSLRFSPHFSLVPFP